MAHPSDNLIPADNDRPSSTRWEIESTRSVSSAPPGPDVQDESTDDDLSQAFETVRQEPACRVLTVDDDESRLSPGLRARRLAEQARLLDLTHDAFLVHQPDGEILYWSRGAESLYRYPWEQALGRNVHDLLKTRFPEDHAEIQRLLQQRGCWEGDLTQQTADGRTIVVSSRWILRSDARSLPVDVFQINRDITAQVHAEQQSRRQCQQLQSVLNLIPGYVAIKDRNHRLRFVNRGFMDLFSDPGNRPCHVVQFGRGQPCPHCLTLEALRFRRPNSTEKTFPNGRTFRVWAHPFTDIDGMPTVLELGVDITPQRQAERMLGELAETQRREIGRELHDSLGQKLTGLGYLLEGLAPRLESTGEEDRRLLEQLRDLVRSAISEVRSLSRGLDPVGVEEEGLEGSLRQLVTETIGGGKVHCDVHFEEGTVLDDKRAMHLYRIVQEALSNAVRHAHASHILVEVRQDDTALILRIRDDGIGIPSETAHQEQTQGMGLRTMRWRATSLGAELTIQPDPQGGTEVLCRLPYERPLP